jgi:ribosomal protein L35AE/L33A
MYEIEAIKGNRFVLSDGSEMRHYELLTIPKDTTVVRIKRDTDKEAQAERLQNKKERAFKKSGLDKKYDTSFDGGKYVGRRIRKKFEDGKFYEGVVSKYHGDSANPSQDPSKSESPSLAVCARARPVPQQPARPRRLPDLYGRPAVRPGTGGRATARCKSA